MGPPSYSNLRNPYNAYGSPARRLPNDSIGAQPSSARYPSAQNRAQNRPSTRGSVSNRDLFAARRRSFHNWYVYNYPTWPGYGYPYLLDPGFYDWDDSDDSGYLQNDAAPYDPAVYPDYGYGAPSEIPPASAQGQPRAAAEPIAPSAPDQPLTVIFKSGRDPVKMQNYMMTAKVLTDLDSRHYEQIPINQIDIAATQWANSAVGVRFEIPGVARD